jgi:hypothetical protein
MDQLSWLELVYEQVYENTLVTLFERVTWPLLFLLQKVSNSFLQNATGYQLPPAKSKKIRENKSVLHAVLHYPLAVC